MTPGFNPFYWLLGARLAPRPLSAAGRMLERLDTAESAVTEQEHITDELRAALRRCEIKSMRDTE